MEKVKEHLRKAKKNLELADHMTYITYNVVKDPKLLLAIIENLFLAMTYSMGSVLHYEKLYKRIPQFKDNFDSKLRVFRERCVSRFDIEQKYLDIMRDLKVFILEHRKSPVEFTKGSRFVICSDTYKMRTISVEEIKNYLSQTKEFVKKMEFILAKNGRILN